MKNPLLVPVIAVITLALSAPFARCQDWSPDGRPFAKDAVEHYNRAVELNRKGKLDEAVSEYEAATRADDRLSEAWGNLSVIYRAQNTLSASNAAFEKFSTLRKNAARTLDANGEALRARGQTEEAIKTWRRAISFDPSLESARKHLEAAGVQLKPLPPPLPKNPAQSRQQ